MNIWLQIDATPGKLQGWAGLGIVIRQNDGTILYWALQQAPAATNNMAEYQAIVYGLRLVQRHYPYSPSWIKQWDRASTSLIPLFQQFISSITFEDILCLL
ncbi:reverse transcriptase-like protein [Herpetosiphon geysericola]|uniref:reverse transcriptase-like protein n=1 Tax=Herpetosiphon geysericola TaxID=70996 RepID=UPI0006C92061|nr:reverse transcriptase-like protein [Herpetosiphon geysericola]